MGPPRRGKIDREIAEELSISVNTEGNHLRSILSKTDSANRNEAAAYAIRRGLEPDGETAGEWSSQRTSTQKILETMV